MKCYKCGCQLSADDFCPNCGADVILYKRIMSIANRFYNEGLEKARVRDLSGSIVSLRQCLKFNKNHVDARNLLGLVYFETGEVVAALSEWVISKNLRPKKNIADDYLNMIQTNQTKLDTINQTIKKYNQALTYCRQDSYDLAIIQLKKVLSLNPKFVRAHQLLALLFINEAQNAESSTDKTNPDAVQTAHRKSVENWKLAKNELDKCSRIDANNTTTLRYMKEVTAAYDQNDAPKDFPFIRKKKDDAVEFKHDNETIIQPAGTFEHKSTSSMVNIVLGLAIGVAVTWGMILPARIQKANQVSDQKVKEIGEQLDEKTATIDDMQKQIDDLKESNTELKSSLNDYQGSDGAIQAMDSLNKAVNAYITNPSDLDTIAQSLDTINVDNLGSSMPDSFTSLYQSMLKIVGPQLSAKSYQEGYKAYTSGDYDNAVIGLSKAYKYDATNEDALYYMAQAYNKAGKTDDASKTYQEVISKFPGTEKANKAKLYLTQITGGQ
jgi:TolA-binding protein